MRSYPSWVAVLTVLIVAGGRSLRFFSVTAIVPSKLGFEVSPDSDTSVLSAAVGVAIGVAVGELTGVAVDVETGVVFVSCVHDNAATQQVSNRMLCIAFMVPFPVNLMFASNVENIMRVV